MLHDAPSSSDAAIKRRNLITLVIIVVFMAGLASTAYFNRVHFLSQMYDQR